MIYEKIDLYDYFSVPRNGSKGGELTVYVREKYTEIKDRIRPAMLVIAGGGYNIVSERESEPVALEFLHAGFSAFSLRYSVNTPFPAPLLEAGMAMAFIRENAEKYSVDRAHVGAIGFSAGGHLTGMLATMFDDGSLKAALGKRAELVRPDAVILCYPVITTGEYSHDGTADTISGGDKQLRRKLSVESLVTEKSSPAFIWHTQEDAAVCVRNSLMLASAYQTCGVPYELHIFERGRHGLGTVGLEVENAEHPEEVARDAAWLALAKSYLKMHGFGLKIKE